MKRLALLLLLLLAACSAHPSDDPREIVALREPLLSHVNFGWRSDTYGACAQSGTCYYPPGFGEGDADLDYAWRVCLNTTGMGLWGSYMAAALVKVRDELKGHGTDIEWVKTDNCGADQNIHVFKGDVAAEASNAVRTYARTVCASAQVLSESPSIGGTHHLCYRHNVTIDIDALVAQYGAQQHQFNHAVGAMFGLATLGKGLTGSATQASYWSYSLMGGVIKVDFPADAYCRASSALYDDPDFFVINKTSTACP